MAATDYFGDSIAVTYEIAGGAALTIAILKGVKISAEPEHIELYGQETVFREDVARVKQKVAVSAKFAKFHPEVLGKILGTEEADKDIDGEVEAGTTRASITDSNVVPLFDLTGTVTGKNGETYDAKVTNVYWEAVPWEAPENDFMMPDLTGFGDKMFLAYITV